MKRALFRAVVVALVLAAGPVIAADQLAGWDRDSAARYLDSRMDLWWDKAKVLKTGAGETKCVSCHTVIPYVLARPVLRHNDDAVAGSPEAKVAATPTAHETRILQTVATRMASGEGNQPFYDHTPAKIVESRGTEAVLNAFIVTHGPATPETEALTKRAIARLWETQRADGAWDWLDFGLEPSESADAAFQGAAIAALALGSPVGEKLATDEASKKGIARLQGYFQANIGSVNLHNKAWALIGSAMVPDLLTAAQRGSIVRTLEGAQKPDGSWSLSSFGSWRYSKKEPPFAAEGTLDQALLDQSDAYATGLAVYALRAVGRSADHPSVQDGQNWLMKNQKPERKDDAAWAPWRAHSLNHDREHGGPKGEPWRRMFMSDFATAFAVLALQ